MTIPPERPSLRRLNIHYALMQTGYWAMYASICAYQTALLLERGFTNSQVGIIGAARCLAGILSQPVIGSFADRHPSIPLKVIFSISMGLSFCVGLSLIFFPLGMGGTLLIFALLGGLEISAYPLMDSMAIQFINDGAPIRYSLGRGIGSLSYGIVGLFLGLQATRWGLESTLITHSILELAELVIVALYPTYRAKPPQKDTQAPQPQSAFSLLRSQPVFSLMLLASFFGLTGLLPLSIFLVNVVVGRGGTNANMGVALFLMASSELPTAFIFSRLKRKFGSARLLCISMAMSAVKALAFLLAGSLPLLLLAQPIQMLSYGLFTPSAVFFVNESVPEADRVKGQSLMMVASNGLGGVLGSALAGRVLDLGGVNTMLIFCVACCLIATGLSALAARSSPHPKDAY